MKKIYIFSLFLVILYSFIYSKILMYICLGILAFWSFIAILNISKDIHNSLNKNILLHFKYYLIPWFLIFAYSITIWLINGDFALNNITRLSSTILFLVLYAGFIASGIEYFKGEIIDIFFVSMAVMYFLYSIIPNILFLGPVNFFEYVFVYNITGQANQYINLYNPLEVHDLTFASGIFLLYYLLFENNKVKFHKLKIFIAVLLVFIGLKRIEIISLFVVIVFYLFTRKIKDIRKLAFFSCIIFLIVSNIFLILIDNSILNIISEKYGINFMGRLSLYDFASNYYEYSPFYLGKGFTKFTRFFSDLYNSGYRINGHQIPASIHSNILELFIEIGMIPYILWTVYYLYFKTSVLQREFDKKSAYIYLVMTIYMFILYFSDNTLTYGLSQSCLFLVPTVCSISYCFEKNYKFLSLNYITRRNEYAIF